MVTISNYFIRQGKDNKPFVALEISGAIQLVQSEQTGRFYATAQRCSIPSTFSEEVAKTLIGKQLPGRIEKVEAAPYEYVVKRNRRGDYTISHLYVHSDRRETAGASVTCSLKNGKCGIGNKASSNARLYMKLLNPCL